MMTLHAHRPLRWEYRDGFSTAPFSRAVAWLLGIVSILGLVHVPRTNAAPESGPKRSRITVHVLDMTLGKPGTASRYSRTQDRLKLEREEQTGTI